VYFNLAILGIGSKIPPPGTTGGAEIIFWADAIREK
jgi:hypothetical protein